MSFDKRSQSADHVSYKVRLHPLKFPVHSVVSFDVSTSLYAAQVFDNHVDKVQEHKCANSSPVNNFSAYSWQP